MVYKKKPRIIVYSRGQIIGPPEMVVMPPRMMEVVDLLCEGLSNEEIAKQLYLSVDSIKTHIRRALVLLRCRNRTEAAVRLWSRDCILVVGFRKYGQLHEPVDLAHYWERRHRTMENGEL